ncbi:MAG: sigma-70 family RNA polymerase sigma factor [Nannocystaceae bacterium]|nr:sigma-70 family RNA polymerase sigma factor [Nannocystaceae bacterium]
MSPPAIALEPAADPARGAARPAAAAATGERALAAIYAEHHAFVWRSLSRLGVDDPRLDDAVHDVFMVVARRLHEFEGRASMRTWLFAIAMRVAQAVRRDATRERNHRERLAREPQPSPSPHEAADAARLLRSLLERLDDDKRAVFIMAELEGMTAPEIAAVIDAKVATVYSRLRLAREQLERLAAAAQLPRHDGAATPGGGA